MKLGWQPRKWLYKKSKLGFRGYPVGTVAFYGPDDQHAGKVAVAVIVAPETEPVALQRWFVESGDVRNDTPISGEIAVFLRGHEVHTVAMTKEMQGARTRKGSIIRKARPVLFVRSGPAVTVRLSRNRSERPLRRPAFITPRLHRRRNQFIPVIERRSVESSGMPIYLTSCHKIFVRL